MILKQEAVAKVVWQDGNHKWYRISKGRNLSQVAYSFSNISSFRYAKVFSFNRKTRETGHQIAHFGVNTKTGELYLNYN